jgi:hypothetical protein
MADKTAPPLSNPLGLNTKLLLDQRSLQVCAHYGGHPNGEHVFASSHGKRLVDFLNVANNAGYSDIQVSSGQDNQFGDLEANGIAVVAILTRLQICPFSKSEIGDLTRFLESGGSVLLMSNYPQFDRNDSMLAELYGFRLGDFVDQPKDPHDGYVHISTEIDRPEVFGASQLEIVFNNCCAVFIENPAAKVVAYLPSHKSGVFAAMVPSVGSDGKFFVSGDSGFIGTCGTREPGPGLMCKADNSAFVEKTLRWLAN